MSIELKDVKKHLHIEFDDDDELIENLIVSAEALIDGLVGTAYKERENYSSDKDYEKGQNLADLLMKKLLNDMYDNRGSVTEKELKNDRITSSILDVLSNIGD